jgi:hypothetical protein
MPQSLPSLGGMHISTLFSSQLLLHRVLMSPETTTTMTSFPV